MRHALRLALALAGGLVLSASASQAADGIKGAGRASREVPADVLTVTFNVTERAGEGADQRTMVARALEEKGLKILESSARFLAAPPPSYSAQWSSGGAREGLQIRSIAAFRITGFKQMDEVLDILARQGVRQLLTLTADHSRADAVREELRKEAVENAIASARRVASEAGVKAGGVVDVTVPYISGVAMPQPYAMPIDQALIDPPRPGELPRLRLVVTANVVLAVKAD